MQKRMPITIWIMIIYYLVVSIAVMLSQSRPNLSVWLNILLNRTAWKPDLTLSDNGHSIASWIAVSFMLRHILKNWFHQYIYTVIYISTKKSKHNFNLIFTSTLILKIIEYIFKISHSGKIQWVIFPHLLIPWQTNISSTS